MTLSNPSAGHNPALPRDRTEDPAAVAWDRAYHATDTHLIAIEGLIHAAFLLASEHPALNTPTPESAALDAVLRTLQEKNEALREARSAEYRLGLDLRRDQPSADERGK